MSGNLLDPKVQRALERDSVDAIGAPFEIKRPKLWRAPVIFASPHSGNIYPDSFLARADCGLKTLRMNEDAYIDELFGAAADIGAPLLTARFPRCFVDVNRAPSELPPDWQQPDAADQSTARAEAGFGVIPMMIAQKTPIYTETPPKDVTMERMERLYVPYHDALSRLIDEALSHFGRAVVIDCHSMPGFAAMGSRRPDIVLGDRYGLSCSPATIGDVETAFINGGYNIVRNSPYAGGYVTAHYGRSAKDPQRAVETVQIEINRDLYLNPVTLAKKPRGFDMLARNLEDIIYQIVMRFMDKRLSGLRAAE